MNTSIAIISGISLLIAYPAWKAAERLLEPTINRWNNLGGFLACIGLLTIGITPVCLGLGLPVIVGFNSGLDMMFGERAQSCTIERFLPDGKSAGVMYISGPCPERP